MQEETVTEKQPQPESTDTIFDTIIIGAGPAGMSAATCASRAKMNVLLIEKAIPGGQTTTACKIDNYLGNPGGILGEDLSKKMEAQLQDHDINIIYESVEDIHNIASKEKIITTDMGNKFRTKSIIVATGLIPKSLDKKFETKFLGRGISYCAQCDVDFYKGKDVVVLGGGNCACYAADYLSDFVNKIYLIHRSDHIRAVKSLKDKIESNSKINIMWNSDITEVFGIDKIEKIKIENILSGQTTWVDIKGIFVYIGRIPPKEILSLDIHVDEKGFIITDDYMRTNVPGIYAAGDMRSKQIRQIATAVSDGMIAAINVERDILR